MNKNTSRSKQLRTVNGILLLDKPLHLTSNSALQKVKNLFAARKAGHTGSLDPLATGMLPICFGEATKFSQYLLEADKRYTVIAKLGIKTATGDAEGEVIASRSVPPLTTENLSELFTKFRGEISQVPSMYSALKHQGRPLYELARQGITIEREARKVIIHELKLLSYTADTLSLEIACSKGTYIRTLVEDIGEALGCGAHVIFLRRLTTAGYAENEMIALSDLEKISSTDPYALDKYLLPIDTALHSIPVINISEAAAFYLLRGQAIIVPQAPKSGMVRLMLNSNRFLGVGEILQDGRVTPRKLIGNQ